MSPADRSSPSPSAEQTAPTRFVWPPGRVELKPGAPDARGAGAAAAPEVKRGALARWWGAIEETWLGLAAAPLAVQAAQAGWSPDLPEVYCPRCGDDAMPMSATPTGCPGCRDKRVPWDRFVRLGAYREPLDGWVREIKFRAWRRLGTQLGALLGRQVRAAAQGQDLEFIVVPVPTSRWRRLARGVDHPLVIARAAARELDAPVWQVLHRRHRPAQVTLSASARARNVRGTMSARGAWAAGPTPGLLGRVAKGLGRVPLAAAAGWTPERAGQTVFLVVDDVSTTGATLREACRAMRKGLLAQGIRSSRVWAGVLARTREQGVMFG